MRLLDEALKQSQVFCKRASGATHSGRESFTCVSCASCNNATHGAFKGKSQAVKEAQFRPSSTAHGRPCILQAGKESDQTSSEILVTTTGLGKPVGTRFPYFLSLMSLPKTERTRGPRIRVYTWSFPSKPIKSTTL